MNNQVQLITYVNRFGGGGLSELSELLNGPLDGLFGGVHLLPFYLPIDGADTGFDPIEHRSVDPRLGDWHDVQAMSATHRITADLIVNHISADSPEFQDYLKKGAQSEFAGMFLRKDKVFPNGATDSELASIYRPRPSDPFRTMSSKALGEVSLWATFTEQQIDLDVEHPAAVAHLKSILTLLAAHGVKTVRLDAVGYAIKKRGTSCFMIEDTYAFIDEITAWARDLGLVVLAEIHAHYAEQLKVAQHVDYVYDFALPPLVLHSLFQNDARALKDWLAISPRNAVTVLDTHDGIGVMDVGPDRVNSNAPGLIPPTYIDAMVERIHHNSSDVSRQASRPDVGNLDLYQVNCTYYDALAGNDHDYLLARLIQFFSPGIPQVYYMGLLAGRNDQALLSRTGSGRDINRAHYSMDDIQRELRRPVVAALMDLIRFRNRHPAFAGTFELLESSDNILHIKRRNGEHRAEMRLDFQSRDFEISYSDEGAMRSASSFGAI